MLRFFLIFMSLLITLFAARISAFGTKYVTEPFTAVEATSPPAEVHGRD